MKPGRWVITYKTGTPLEFRIYCRDKAVCSKDQALADFRQQKMGTIIAVGESLPQMDSVEVSVVSHTIDELHRLVSLMATDTDFNSLVAENAPGIRTLIAQLERMVEQYGE